MLGKLGVIRAKNYYEPYYFLRSQTISNYDGHSIASVVTAITSDSVLHMARAIISEAMSLDDREVNIDNEIKTKIRGVNLSKKDENELFLQNFGKIFKRSSFESKKASAELLSIECKNEYEKIRLDKDVKICIFKIRAALRDYKNSKTKTNAEKVADAQLYLINVLNSGKCLPYVKEVLNKIFMREAVEGFQKEFGDLKDVKTLREMKLFLNRLYEDILDAYARGYFDEYEKGLIYGFGHCPAPTRINLKYLNEIPEKAGIAVWTLSSMSLNYSVSSKNGKRFEIFETASRNDKNCAFRAIAVGAGFGPNGYNEVQKKVIDGAEKLLSELERGFWPKILDTDVILGNIINVSNMTAGRLAKYLKEYISDRKNGFVDGMTDIEFSLAAIGLGHPICVIDYENGSEYTYLPNGKKIEGIKHDDKDKPIYISKIYCHSTALLPLDGFDYNLSDNSMLEREVKDAVKKSMLSIMLEEIGKGKSSKLLKSMSRYPNFYVGYNDENKKTKNNEDLYTIMDMIGEIVEKMSSKEKEKIEKIEQELSYLAKEAKNIKDIGAIGSKLEEYTEIISQKAVSICKYEPLFWYNYKTTKFD